MVSLPWVVRISAFAADVTNNCIISDLLSGLAISARVKDFFLGIALGNLLISPVVRSLVGVASILASAESATDNAGSHEGHG